MIKGKKIAAAVLCTTALTGCGSFSRMPKIYRETLDYTLGDYTMGEPKKYDDGDIEWNITFTDKNGNEQNAYLLSGVYDDVQKKYFDNKEDLQKNNLFEFYSSSMLDIAANEMWNDIISEHFEMEAEQGSLVIKNDEVSVVTAALPAISLLTSDKAYALVENEISPKSGIKLCEEDLSSVVSKDYMITTFSVTVSENVDPEPYIEKTKAVLSDFEKYAPQNYTFRLKNSDKEVLFVKHKLLGREIDSSELVDDEGNSILIREAVVDAIGLND